MSKRIANEHQQSSKKHIHCDQPTEQRLLVNTYKHTSKLAQNFLEVNGENLFKLKHNSKLDQNFLEVNGENLFKLKHNSNRHCKSQLKLHKRDGATCPWIILHSIKAQPWWRVLLPRLHLIIPRWVSTFEIKRI